MTARSPAGKSGRPAKIPGEKPTRERIFDAAIGLFAERGYDRTSIRDIAGAVGISESAVYRHYPSKESILDAIFAYIERRVYSPLPPVTGAGEDTDHSVFRDMLEGLPRYIMADPSLVRIIHILFMEMHHNAKIRDYMRKEYGVRADDYTEAVFRQQMEEKRIRSCDPRALAEVFNAFRFAWLWQTFILDYGKPRKTEEMEEDLQAPIGFFETIMKP